MYHKHILHCQATRNFKNVYRFWALVNHYYKKLTTPGVVHPWPGQVGQMALSSAVFADSFSMVACKFLYFSSCSLVAFSISFCLVVEPNIPQSLSQWWPHVNSSCRCHCHGWFSRQGPQNNRSNSHSAPESEHDRLSNCSLGHQTTSRSQWWPELVSLLLFSKNFLLSSVLSISAAR